MENTASSTTLSRNGDVQPESKQKYLGSKIWQVEPVGRKPHFLVASKSVVNTKSDFQHKLLCDGLTFTAGHACTYSCTFCYVGPMMRKNANLSAAMKSWGGGRSLRHEDLVVDIANPLKGLRSALMIGKKRRYDDPKDRRIIYGSPLVDVCGTHEQTETTIKICREILAQTNWQIRLLSKSPTLVKVAHALDKHLDRMIFGFSTGTLDDKAARCIEMDTPLVSARLKALAQLQKEKFRTFGMLCPVLPQTDYKEFAAQVKANEAIMQCEHVWAEVLNSRGDSMHSTSAALRQGGFAAQADLLDLVARNSQAWDEYALETFLALSRVIPAGKLRFLQYVEPRDYALWEKHKSKGAVLLGSHIKLIDEIDGIDTAIKPKQLWTDKKRTVIKTDEVVELAGRNVNVVVVKKLETKEREKLARHEKTIRDNADQFREVCIALFDIHKEQLYRETHSTFEAYCRARFDFGLAHGKRLVTAGGVIADLEKKQNEMAPNGAKLLPKSEAQARELAHLDTDDQLEVLRNAVANAGDKQVTAMLIQHEASKLLPAKAVAYPTFRKYTTDLQVFLDWLAALKHLAKSGQHEKLNELLERAEQSKAIIPTTTADTIAFSPDRPDFDWMSTQSDHKTEFEGNLFSTEALFQFRRFEGHKEVQKKLSGRETALDEKTKRLNDPRTIAQDYRHLLRNPESSAEIEIMRECLRLKMADHPYLVKTLLATGDRPLVADVTSNSKQEALFWGMALVNGQWVGHNWLGKLWEELRADKPKIKQSALDDQINLAEKAPLDRIRLYGKNKQKSKGKLYWTDIDKWIRDRKQITKREPYYTNVTSNGSEEGRSFRELSPILMGPIDCYQENGHMVRAISLEVAWQYSKVYFETLNEDGSFTDRRKEFIARDATGRIVGPTKEWFHWRDEAFGNPEFSPDRPDLDKGQIRRAYLKGSKVAFWFWDGQMLDAIQARQKIYAKLYKQFVEKTPAYQQLRGIFAGSKDEPGRDIQIFDYDGYDWTGLNRTPAECIKDTGHSFGHGMCIAFLLLGIDPTELVPDDGKFDPTKLVFGDQADDTADGTVKLNLDWRRYDAYFKESKTKQKPMRPAEKSAIERFAAKVLLVAPSDVEKCWGEAYPPGCFATTVIRIQNGVQHHYSARGVPVCLKIFNSGRGTGEWNRLHRFHTEYRDKLPGLPKHKVQQVLDIGSKNLANGERPYLVQEWVAGETVEALIQGGANVTREDVLKLLDELFLTIVIPAWSQGTKWWDARRSNYVFTLDKRLLMIDPDVLADYCEEIVTTPEKFTKRNSCNPDVAIARYETLIIDLALACTKAGVSRGFRKIVRKLCTTHLHPLFRGANCRYPLAPEWKNQATAAYQTFRNSYEQLLDSTARPQKPSVRQANKIRSAKK